MKTPSSCPFSTASEVSQKKKLPPAAMFRKGWKTGLQRGRDAALAMEDLLAFVASKRYPLTRVKRIFLSILLGLTKKKKKKL